MRLFLCFLLSLGSCITSLPYVAGAELTDQKLFVREISVEDSGKGNNTILEDFIEPTRGSFFSPSIEGGEGLQSIFIVIAYNVKNFFIFIAIMFLLVGVMKLLFSKADEEAVKKWRSNIIWVSVGIVVMQLAYSIWITLLLQSNTDIIGSGLGGRIWTNILLPLVKFLQMFAAFGFIAMAVYAFYVIVTSAGEEEGYKKGKNILIYSIVGFILIRLPQALVSAIYGKPNCKNTGPFNLITIGDCAIENQDINASISIFGKIINFLNSFLAIIAILLIIYAGWLLLISGGDEEKLKKAKNIIIYIAIGLVLLVASHALFRFFILKG